jgi:hypothetical protein
LCEQANIQDVITFGGDENALAGQTEAFILATEGGEMAPC